MKLDEKLGICVKTTEKEVTFQNDICLKTCGERVGTICEKGCMENYEHKLPAIQSEGMSLIKNSNIDGKVSDAVVINDTKTITTIFYPLTEKINTIEKELLELKTTHRLTNSEMDILSMTLKGMKNSDIAKKLFIARSTLKTHLNNIYKKIPPKWHFLQQRK